MTVHFLGNGGFINKGLPYNSFIIDNNFLIESPPDIIPSLYKQGIDLLQINRIYISHFHGDHYFGMPFLTLNLFNRYLENNLNIKKIDAIGPENIRKFIIDLQKIAVSSDNPSVAWIDSIYNFIEINTFSQIQLNNSKRMLFHKMFHGKETYGFSIIDHENYILTYFPDTQWDKSFTNILSYKPKYLICDLNSNSSDKIRVHMSEQDIINNAIPITGNSTKFIGTHLRDEPGVSTNKYIEYAKAGNKYEI